MTPAKLYWFFAFPPRIGCGAPNPNRRVSDASKARGTLHPKLDGSRALILNGCA